jgi:hypothetical protein
LVLFISQNILCICPIGDALLIHVPKKFHPVRWDPILNAFYCIWNIIYIENSSNKSMGIQFIHKKWKFHSST